jgi:hypothetical protein
MRKILIPLAAAAATLAFAAPASAQYYPQPMGYAYGQYGQAHIQRGRMLQVRLDQIQRETARLARYGMLSRSEYRRLHNESRQIERNLRRNVRDGYGLTPREAYDVERRIARLEQRLFRDARDGRRYAYGRRR